ncbi:MAG: hypothetical protein AAGK04_02500 [Planctomycetota bacterium]
MKGPVAWLLAGGFAGAIGVVVWAAIAYYTGFEIGYIAIGIGALVGLAIKAVDNEGGMARGLAAAIIAALSIAGGKYAAVSLHVGDEIDSAMASVDFSDEFVKTFLADAIAEREMEAGNELAWPDDSNADSFDATGADYPPEVWAETEAAWAAFTETDRQQWRDTAQHTVRTTFDQMSSMVTEGAFAASFGILDILFFGIAVFAAFKVAATEGEG